MTKPQTIYPVGITTDEIIGEPIVILGALVVSASGIEFGEVIVFTRDSYRMFPSTVDPGEISV